MKYKIKPAKSFVKNLKRLTATEQKTVAKKLMLMMENPFYPSLIINKIKVKIFKFLCSKYHDTNCFGPTMGLL
ncbi:MAG: hypothetical protein Q7J15_00545 [Candidatus Desulfaltia sp.]|nr:hypothetical protein [Candidatus Desulfaltia sp.]